jgi:hypothetical protein
MMPKVVGPPLELDIQLRSSGELRARLIDPQDGASQWVATRVTIPLRSWEIEAASSRHVRSRSVRAGTADPAHDVGARLFDALFTDVVGKLYTVAAQALQTGRGLVIRVLARDPESAALPWELLFDESVLQGFVARTPGVSILRRPADDPVVPSIASHIEILAATTLAENLPRLAMNRGLGQSALSAVEFLDPVKDARSLQEACARAAGQVLYLRVATTPPWQGKFAELQLQLGTVAVSRLQSMLIERTPLAILLDGPNTDLIAVELGRVVPLTAGLRGLPDEEAGSLFLRVLSREIMNGCDVSTATSMARDEVGYRYVGSTEWASGVVVAAGLGPLVTTGSTPAVAGSVQDPRQGTTLEDLSLALEASTVSGSSAASLRAVDLANLDSLLGTWSGVEPELWPRLVQEQIDALGRRMAPGESNGLP